MKYLKHLILLCFFPLIINAQNQTTTVILTTGDTLFLEKVVQDENTISGYDIRANKPRRMPLSVVSQFIEACAFEKDEIDDMTGRRIRLTKPERIGGNAAFAGMQIQVRGFRVDDLYSLKFFIIYPGVFSMDKGAKVLLKCADEKVHELNTLEYVMARHTGSNIWTGEITMPLAGEKMDTLENCKLTKVRLYFNRGYVDLEVKDKKQDGVSRVVRCLR
jgi:hypothetical protein